MWSRISSYARLRQYFHVIGHSATSFKTDRLNTVGIKKIGLAITSTLLMWGNELAGQSHRLPMVDCKSHFDKLIAVDVYPKPAKPPSFPGGNPAWVRFLSKKFRYPQQEMANGPLQTRATATFIVDSAGLLHNIGIKGKKEIEWTPFEKTFVKVVKESGLWTPGECNGRRVASYFEQLIQVEVDTYPERNGL
jgi:protein TonB